MTWIREPCFLHTLCFHRSCVGNRVPCDFVGGQRSPTAVSSVAEAWAAKTGQWLQKSGSWQVVSLSSMAKHVGESINMSPIHLMRAGIFPLESHEFMDCTLHSGDVHFFIMSNHGRGRVQSMNCIHTNVEHLRKNNHQYHLSPFSPRLYKPSQMVGLWLGLPQWNS